MRIVHGVNPSPYVRKVRLALNVKGLDYQLEPVVPVDVPASFKEISPLGKIPAFQDGDVALADSSVICAYLEKAYPQPSLYPEKPADFGHALWLEEYADTALAGGLIPIFFQKIVGPKVFDKPTDDAVVEKALKEDVPPLFDYLETQVGNDQYLINNTYSIADMAIISQFINHYFSGYTVDQNKWPRLARYIDGLMKRKDIEDIIQSDKAFLKLDA